MMHNYDELRSVLRNLVSENDPNRPVAEMLAATVYYNGPRIRFPEFATAIWRDALRSQRAKGLGEKGLALLTTPGCELIMDKCIENLMTGTCYEDAAVAAIKAQRDQRRHELETAAKEARDRNIETIRETLRNLVPTDDPFHPVAELLAARVEVGREDGYPEIIFPQEVVDIWMAAMKVLYPSACIKDRVGLACLQASYTSVYSFDTSYLKIPLGHADCDVWHADCDAWRLLNKFNHHNSAEVLP